MASTAALMHVGVFIMPKGYAKDGRNLGDASRLNPPPNGKHGSRKDRFTANELSNHPEIVKEIIDLYMVKGWTAPNIVKHFHAKGEKRVKDHTIYLLARRMRKKMAKAREAGEPQPIKSTRMDDLQIVAGNPDELQVDENTLVVPDNEPKALIQRTKAFLAEQTFTAQKIAQTTLERAQQAAESDDDPTKADTWLRASGRAVGLVRTLSGVEDDAKVAAANRSPHLHLHGSAVDPFKKR